MNEKTNMAAVLHVFMITTKAIDLPDSLKCFRIDEVF